MTPKLLMAALSLGAISATAQQVGTPRIYFDQTVFDFGKTSQVATVTGIFTFQNTGDGILKIEPPKPSCGCTAAEVKPDTLQPGETGELPFTLNLGQYRAMLEKRITVRSNDPKTPEINLAIKVDYTPLYELNPVTLSPIVAFGASDATQFTTLTRTDGKPLRIARLDPSKPWITAKLERAPNGDESITGIRITVKRDGTPRRFAEYVQIYSEGQTNTPVTSIYVYGQMQGQIVLNPEALYWSVSEGAVAATDRPEATILRRVIIRSSTDAPMALKNPQSTIKGVTVELIPKEEGKAYELIARLDEVPPSTVSGNVSFETSVAAQSRIEVPIIVNVFKQ